MRAAIWTANLLGWPVLQLAIAWFSLHCPLENFAEENSLYRLRPWERSGSFYRRWFAVHRWKSSLPDGGAWFGGFPKKNLARRDIDYLSAFILETRRAEFAHWCMLCCFPVFFLWNPPWAWAVMAVYAVTANLPFIIVQRYNRAALTRICARSRTSSSPERVQVCS